MTFKEWDYDNPVHRRRRRRPPPPLEGEILTPESEPQRVHVNINVHRRSGIPPNFFVVGALALIALRFLPYLGIGLLIIVALALMYCNVKTNVGLSSCRHHPESRRRLSAGASNHPCCLVGCGDRYYCLGSS
jgi:hypothetical protein